MKTRLDKNVKALKQLLQYEGQLKVKIGKELISLNLFIELRYCCFNTWEGIKEPGTLEKRETLLLKSIGTKEAILLKLRYGSLAGFRRGIDRYLIDQTAERKRRFKYITETIFYKVGMLISDIDLNQYVKENFNSLASNSIDRMKILQALGIGVELKKPEVKPAKKVKEKPKWKERTPVLCPFSGSGHNPDTPRRTCSRTEDPYRKGDCSTCRVAAEWEECYG